jgi:lipopolysaccharide transport system ATP-binding protein
MILFPDHKGRMNTNLSSNNTAILLENICVYFSRRKEHSNSIKELSIRILRGVGKKRSIKALDDISMDIHRGEVYGVVGRNGSGKSTLLRVLSRITMPTSGRIQIWGKTSPLLGVGAGFHPELTGRENIFLYSSILGRTTARTKAMLDQIVEFSELSDFIDEPIRIYSSGMVARLGFSIAMAEPPEILLVDEVLSVGDESFKDKCKLRFNEFSAGGSTIVFVSHNLKAVQEMCSRSSWLNQGKMMMTGETKDVLRTYQEFMWKR